MDYIKSVESKSLKENLPQVRVGNEVKVYFKILEGKVERVQVYQGVVISIANSGLRRSFTVRKVSYNIGVERVFPLNSPKIEKIEIVRVLRVKRAKLYFLRERKGKSARLKEVLKRKDKKAQ